MISLILLISFFISKIKSNKHHEKEDYLNEKIIFLNTGIMFDD